MSDYMLALLFGAAIVVIFAWDQFNRPSYEPSRELTRLIELLTPSRMRRRTVYWRAYVFYAGILLLVYFTLCAYGALLFPVLGLEIPGYGGGEEAAVGASEIPVGQAAAPEPPTSGYAPDGVAAGVQALAGASPEADAEADGGIRTDPTVPLFVSLVMIGLAPSVPILLRLEQKVRFAAHRLSGIPTRLISGSRQLRLKPLNLDSGADSYLIAPQDWRRLEHYAKAAAGRLDDPLAFREDLAKILAFRAWVLQEKLPLGNHVTRDSVAAIEADIGKSIERLIFGLDTLTGFEGAATAADESRSPDQARLAWEAAAREADQNCADICVLTMLYVEHGVLPTEDDAERFGWGGDPDATVSDPARQKLLAERKLIAHVSDAARWVDRESLSIVLWARATAVALIVALLFGMAFGRDTVESAEGSLAGTSQFVLGMLYLMSAALTYALALLVAISWHQTAYQNGSWRNVFRDHWARWAPQLAAVFLLSGLASVICVVGYNIAATINVVGFKTVLDNLAAVLRYALEYEGPRALLGPMLALVVILITDAWRSGERARKWLDVLPAAAGAAMFAAGAGTRLMVSQIAASAPTGTATFELWSLEVWREALPAGLLAGLIGLAVGYFVRATLVHEFPRAKDDSPAPRPGGGAASGAAQPAE